MKLFKVMLIGFALFFIAACDTESSDTENGETDEIPGETDDGENGTQIDDEEDLDDQDSDEDDDEDIDDQEDDNDIDNDDEESDEEETGEGITLTFVDHEGNIVEELIVVEDRDFVLPDGPKKEGHSFVSWDLEYDFLEFETDKTIEPIFEINVYTVTVNGPEGTIETLDVEHGQSIDLDDPETIDGYRFVEYENVPDYITEDTVVEALFAEIGEVTLNFHDGYGDFIETYTGYLDEDYSVPEVDEYYGYTFEGFGKDLEGEAINISALEAGEYDLYAIYKAETVTVTFDFNDGSDPLEKSFEYNEEYTISDVIEIPEREAYTFSHWEDDEGWYYIVDYLYIDDIEPIHLEAYWDGETDEWLFDVQDNEATLVEYLGDDQDIVIPDMIGGKPVGVIGEELFENHFLGDGIDIKSVVIGENVHTIEAYAFAYQHDLESVIFENPGTLRHIKESVFRETHSIDLSVPGYLETLGARAFYRSGVSSATFNGDIEKIGESAFLSSDLSGAGILPESMKEIGEAAFQGTYIDTVELNEGLEIIRKRAFMQVENIETITIPSSVEVFEDRIFSDAHNLESVTFESGSPITEIKERTFDNTFSLTTIVLPESLEFIGRHAFSKSTSLEALDLPKTVHGFGWGAFYKVESLESLTIPEGVTTLSGNLLYGASSLSSIHLPESLETIGAGAFNRATSIEVIDIPEGVKEIGNGAFRETTSLHTLELPEDLEVLGEHAFDGNKSLTEITIPQNITVIMPYLFARSNIQTVHMHNEITKIRTGAFSYTALLDNLVIPSSVTEMEHMVFQESDIDNVYLPISIAEMGSNVFRFARNVTIFYEGPAVPESWLNFNPNDRTIIFGASSNGFNDDE